MYRVIWEIDIDAETPLEAARKALCMQRDPESIATAFAVKDRKGHVTQVDLSATAIPVLCPACGADNVGRIDAIPGYARLKAVRLDGQIEWSGDTDVQWSEQRPANNPPDYLCMTCGEPVSLAALIAKVIRKRQAKRRRKPC